MTDFAATLRDTLQGLSEAAQIADRDLHDAVAEVDKGILAITNGRVSAKLVPILEDQKGVFYRIDLINETKPLAEVAKILVPQSGYPIIVLHPSMSETRSMDDHKQRGTTLGDREAIERYFADMAKNPDSVLVQNLAFYLRRAS